VHSWNGSNGSDEQDEQLMVNSDAPSDCESSDYRCQPEYPTGECLMPCCGEPYSSTHQHLWCGAASYEEPESTDVCYVPIDAAVAPLAPRWGGSVVPATYHTANVTRSLRPHQQPPRRCAPQTTSKDQAFYMKERRHFVLTNIRSDSATMVAIELTQVFQEYGAVWEIKDPEQDPATGTTFVGFSVAFHSTQCWEEFQHAFNAPFDIDATSQVELDREWIVTLAAGDQPQALNARQAARAAASFAEKQRTKEHKPLDVSRLKTKLCRNFQLTGQCKFGSRCGFIHATGASA